MQGRINSTGCIQKTVCRVKSPRDSCVKSGQGNHFPYPLFYLLNSIAKILLFITEIGTQT